MYAMFLDPRHLFELTIDECIAVKNDLTALYKRLKGNVTLQPSL